nr:MAG: putative capsid protein [Picobirnavirus sp.]
MKNNSKMKSSSSNKRGKFNRKGDKPVQKQNCGVKATSGTSAYDNAFAWYNKNPMLLESAARIPFAVPNGGTFNWGSYVAKDGTNYQKGSANGSIAGIMAIDFSPTVGYSNDDHSPATIAARELYAKVRKAYSGTLSVDAPDIMMYLLSLDGIFSYIAKLKRIYRTINVYSGVNKYTPNGLILAELGKDESQQSTAFINDLRANKTRLWGGINSLIANASKFTCPAVMDIFNRHYWMNDNYFMDRPNRKAQIYLFRQMVFWKFGLDSERRGQVTLEELTIDLSKDAVDQLLNFGNALLGALNDDEDAYTINGYLQRAFESTPNYVVEPLREEEMAEFVYSAEVLNQIHNAKPHPLAGRIKTSVTQTGLTNVVHSVIEGTVDADNFNPINTYYNGILDVEVENPSIEEVTVASRLMYGYDFDKTTRKITLYPGTEVVNHLMVYKFHALGSISGGDEIKSLSDTLPMTSSATLQLVCNWALFHKAPLIMLGIFRSDDKTADVRPLGDVTNPTFVNTDTMKDLNRMCIYSEFNSFSIE